MTKYIEYKEILSKYGVDLLTTQENFISSQSKYDLKCVNGHVWNARLSDVISKGLTRESKGCPHCAKKITDKLSEIAVEKNLIAGHKILSYEIRKIKSDGTKERFYTVQCPNNHLYEKRTPTLKEGCPKCSTGVFVGEERVKIIFEKHFGKKFKKIRPEWLTNPNTQSKMEIDGYNEDLKIGFEYQGRQHHSNKTQFAGEYKEQSFRDELKKELCEQNNVTLYIVNQPNSYAEDKFTENVLLQLKEQGLIISEETNFCFKDINKDISLQNKYDEFKKLVNEQNINLVSTSLSTMEDELEFKCEKEHSFKMNCLKFKEIIKGKKGRNYICIECNDNVGVKEVINLETVKNFAQSINYQLLSTSYKAVNEPMDWICNNGHKITKNYRSFQRSKTKDYCEECAKSIKKVHSNVETQFKTASGGVIDLKTVKEFANSIGYQLVSTNYHNVNEKMHWICNNGHNVHKSYRQFQRNQTGNYCEECLKENPSLKVKVVSSTQFKAKDGDIIDLNAVKGFAASIGFQLLADTYNNVNEKMHWICNNGHNVHKSYRQFQRNKTGNYCDECKK